MTRKKKIVLLGDTDSPWLKFYLENVVLDYTEDITLLTIRDNWNEWYEKSKIKMISIAPEKEWLLLSEDERMNLLIMKRNMICDNINNIDILQAHFCQGAKMYCYKRLASKSKRSIMTYWGSDLLRANESEITMNIEAIDKSDFVTVITKHMKEVFLGYYKNIGEKKCRILDFGVSAYEYIDKYSLEMNQIACKRYYGIEEDSVAVMLGYNGLLSQQHIKAIEQIKKMPKNILEKITLVLHMGYGCDEKYVTEIRTELELLNSKFIIIEEFLDYDKIAILRLACDIFIHAQTTDALSASILEYLYAGAILVNPTWIKYKEYEERNIKYYQYETFEELAPIICGIIERREYETYDRKKYRQTLYELNSWAVLKEKWLELYE